MSSTEPTVTVSAAYAAVHAIEPNADGLIPWATALTAVAALGKPPVDIPQPRHAADNAEEAKRG